jgi:hypothetical protein
MDDVKKFIDNIERNIMEKNYAMFKEEKVKENNEESLCLLDMRRS